MKARDVYEKIFGLNLAGISPEDRAEIVLELLLKLTYALEELEEKVAELESKP